ncbi:MAG: hypothetical protein M3N26_12000 [Pseudomonadota bacterium]|nr:hypothetical protein [Pseudomonadota bacterium]
MCERRSLSQNVVRGATIACLSAVLFGNIGAAARPSPPRAGSMSLPSSQKAAVKLALGRRTEALTTVAQTLTYAERASGRAFTVEGVHAEHRPGEPYARVHICYRLGTQDDQPICNIDYLVTVDPPHVEPADRFDGIGRDFEHGPHAFLKALAREAELRHQPELVQAFRDVVEPYNPYDWR